MCLRLAKHFIQHHAGGCEQRSHARWNVPFCLLGGRPSSRCDCEGLIDDY